MLSSSRIIPYFKRRSTSSKGVVRNRMSAGTPTPPYTSPEGNVSTEEVTKGAFGRALLRAMMKRWDVRAGLAILVFFTVVAMVGSFWTPYPPLAPVGPGFAPPSSQFRFGTTNIGQDVFSQWMDGGTPTLEVGFLSALMTAGLGITTGIAAGYIKKADEPLMRGADVILTLPALPLLILIAIFFTPNDFNVAVLIAMLSWAGMARTLRSSVLSLKQFPFVEVAILSSVPSYKIMFVDMFKHTLPLILTYSLFAVGGAILSVASLDFLGIGPVTDNSWGSMASLCNDNNCLLQHAWWWAVVPALSIAILVTGLALIAYGLEAAFKNM
jgi:peptide/nickel transport system permease protein